MKLALAQIDTTVGDIRGNLDRILGAYRRAATDGAELVVFPELAVCGYPPLDLLEQSDFVAANLAGLKTLAKASGKAGMLVGCVEPNPARGGKPLFNAAALLNRGKVAARRFKTLLPTYDVFDESRYFEPAGENAPVRFLGRRLGVTICEDAWNDAGFWRHRLYAVDPVERLTRAGAELLVNLSSSPFHRGKVGLRLKMLRSHARKLRRPLAYCNLVGGNDELVFDGHSLALDAKGRVLARGRSFEEDLVFVDLEGGGGAADLPELPEVEQVRRALVLGLRDYCRKCGFKDVLVGLSGGIDSALVCALAAEALGPERVTGVLMPSRFSSKGSVDDAAGLARNLGVKTSTLPIEDLRRAYLDALAEPFRGTPEGLAEQNLQARIRGNLLMALSNKTGALLLSTGNKSEVSVGYCTLYGDMSGGLAVIADVPKTLVYEIARDYNRGREVIPEASLTKAPSAELKPDQKDQDDLPPYEVLDRILKGYVEDGKTPAAIAAGGVPRALVDSIVRRIDRAEYKRRQAAPGLKITPKAFGMGRRMPIARGEHR